MTGFRFWQDLTTKDFEDLDPERTVAVLPVGAIEQHGPHLPVSTDACLAGEIAHRALRQIAPDTPALLLPLTSAGKSDEHISFPGTLTHSAQTLIAMWTELGESVHRAGIRKLLFLNAHGGQPQIMDIVARELRVRCTMLCVTCNWWHLGLPEGLVPNDERRFGIHGGTVETSMMLHLRPDLVRMDKAENFVPVMADIEGRYEHLRYTGGPGIGWQAQDIHPEGVAGDATAASAETGRKIVEHVTARFAKLVDEVSAYSLNALRDR